ncbi:MAG: hypothetical protein AB7V39_23360, partial [Nitrospiraceae bacterium]
RAHTRLHCRLDIEEMFVERFGISHHCFALSVWDLRFFSWSSIKVSASVRTLSMVCASWLARVEIPLIWVESPPIGCDFA